MQRPDERDLVRRAQQRDADALSELYRRHVEQVYRYILSRVGDAAVAEDLTSDVFLRALEKLGAYEQRGAPFASWLYRIANTRVIDYWRRAKRRSKTLHAADEEAWLEVSSGDVIDRRTLAEAINDLTAEQQEVILLKFAGGFSTSEIARMTGRTEGAVKALQHRALSSLARRMKQ